LSSVSPIGSRTNFHLSRELRDFSLRIPFLSPSSAPHPPPSPLPRLCTGPPYFHIPLDRPSTVHPFYAISTHIHPDPQFVCLATAVRLPFCCTVWGKSAPWTEKRVPGSQSSNAFLPPNRFTSDKAFPPIFSAAMIGFSLQHGARFLCGVYAAAGINFLLLLSRT